MHGTNGSGGGFAAGTWNRLTGPGRVFDTTKYYIVVPDGILYRVEDTGVAWSVWVADPDGFQLEVTCYYFPVTPEAGDD